MLNAIGTLFGLVKKGDASYNQNLIAEIVY